MIELDYRRGTPAIKYNMKGCVKMSDKEFPMMLTANDLQAMGFHRNMVYQILNRSDVPVVKIGKRKFVRRDKFFSWLEEQEIKNEEGENNNGSEI